MKETPLANASPPGETISTPSNEMHGPTAASAVDVDSLPPSLSAAAAASPVVLASTSAAAVAGVGVGGAASCSSSMTSCSSAMRWTFPAML